jgi:hypothetical protein
MEVKTISQAARFSITSADEQQPNYSVLSITPRFTKGSDLVSFFLSDGTVLRARLVVVTKPMEKSDSFYEVKTKDSEIDKIRDAPSMEERLSELELLKAMASGRRLRGFRISQTSKDIDLGISGVECQLIQTYTGSDLDGYVFELKNQNNKNVFIDLTRLSLGNDEGVLSQIDSEKISKKGTDGSTVFLRMVAKADSRGGLPIAPLTAIADEK